MSLLVKIGDILAAKTPVKVGNVCKRCGFSHAYKAQVFVFGKTVEKKLCLRCNAPWEDK
jgi:ribosomal protein L40E